MDKTLLSIIVTVSIILIGTVAYVLDIYAAIGLELDPLSVLALVVIVLGIVGFYESYVIRKQRETIAELQDDVSEQQSEE